MITPQQIQAQIDAAHNILLIASTPVDGDSIGSTMAMYTYLQRLHKQVELAGAENFALHFPAPFLQANKIKHVQFASYDLNKFDLIMIFDGGGWLKILGENYAEVLSKIDVNKTILIDHHRRGDAAETLGENAFVHNATSCAEVLLMEFFQPLQIELGKNIASLLYYAMAQDTGRFSFVGANTFVAAKILLDAGIDHNFLIQNKLSEQRFRFTAWALAHTKMYPLLETMILPIYEQDVPKMQRLFGANWEELDLDEHYKFTYFRNIEGYNYGFTLALEGSKVEMRWRVDNAAKTLDLAPLLTEAGFEHVGGHRNAGGGQYPRTVHEAELAIVNMLEKYLPTVDK
jgi:phosphoesterase RecJ-like protein